MAKRTLRVVKWLKSDAGNRSMRIVQPAIQGSMSTLTQTKYAQASLQPLRARQSIQ
ncbi:MAG: hypothetical protein JWN74_460 [Acidobacteriaceae bacterium]|nr:hypothetical protein [Acidobacteriaceae bacterium]